MSNSIHFPCWPITLPIDELPKIMGFADIDELWAGHWAVPNVLGSKNNIKRRI
jgi:hypothetical protein